MLKKFTVKNFKNFKDEFVFDLSSVKNYEFNPECVKNGIVANGIVYGPNGCGKTNLGYAVFDIRTHLTDEKTNNFYGANYLHAANNEEPAEFHYTFQFEDDTVEYGYKKRSVAELVCEELKINDKQVVLSQREMKSEAFIGLQGAETLNRNIASQSPVDAPESLSAIKYVARSTVLEDNEENMAFRTFVAFVKGMSFHTTSNTYALSRLSGGSANFFVHRKMIDKLQRFLGQAGFECQLTTMDIEGEEVLAFQVGKRKIAFWSNASTGTLSLAYQFLRFEVLKMQAKLISENQDLASQESRGQLQKQFPQFSLDGNAYLPFLFVDEFDAFYHYAASRRIVEAMRGTNCQFILTTHNTGIMSNDLLRPDCYFIMSNTDIRPAYTFTDKELRKAHNIEKMYRAGVFSDG